MTKSRSQRQDGRSQDHELRKFAKVIDAVTSLVHALFRYSAIILPFYFMYRTAAVLAGKLTSADIALKLLGSLTINQSVAYTLGVGGILYGLAERGFRRRKTEYFQGRIRELEEQLDPKRTSSRLTTRGTTNPLDGD